jgi:DnaK suppressor protein
MAQYDEAAARQRLDAERERLERDIYDRTQGDAALVPVDPLSDAGGLAADQADDADAMSDVERDHAILRNTRQLLTQVRAAIERLDAGRYGICERCGKDISARRLDALPYVTLCVDCQALVEQENAV